MDTAQAILKAARKSFDRKGLEGLSLRDVAKDVGVTPMAIYRHYENKQALVDALVLDGLATWSARVAALPAAPLFKKFEQLDDAFLDFALEEPRRFEAAFLIHSKAARKYPDDFVAGCSPVGALQLKLMEEASKQGLLADVPPVEILVTIAGLSQGLVTLYRAGRIAGGEAEFRTLFKRAMRRCINSFRKETPK
jgi:AcrR family transcriptional regulator